MSRDPFYSSPHWRRLRLVVLNAHPLCTTAGCGRGSVVADHIVPRSQGGADDLANLTGRCWHCHQARRGTAEPRLRGCDARGTPRDQGHWWNTSPAAPASNNRPQLAGQTAPHPSKNVSLASKGPRHGH
ncbi:HNH endonuclease [Roseomonas sp. BN140053]|uniref:HNH endonuclease n=1 Tax=Roseomonas sp. BN140053 TaxID=3391898 RepID=UPI0039EA007E